MLLGLSGGNMLSELAGGKKIKIYFYLTSIYIGSLCETRGLIFHRDMLEMDAFWLLYGCRLTELPVSCRASCFLQSSMG